jgi:hypothetical protein
MSERTRIPFDTQPCDKLADCQEPAEWKYVTGAQLCTYHANEQDGTLPPTIADLERQLAEAQKELKAANHVLEMDDPRLLKCVQTIDRVLRERNEAQGKLDAVEAMMKALPPLDWESYDKWGDYAGYPLSDGSFSSVDSSNQGDVHSHGHAVGRRAVHEALDRILKGE